MKKPLTIISMQKSTSFFTFSLRYCKYIINLLFQVLWTCLDIYINIPTIVVKKQVHMLKNLSQCVIHYDNRTNIFNILISIGKHCIFYMLQGMSYYINDISFNFFAFLANGHFPLDHWFCTSSFWWSFTWTAKCHFVWMNQCFSYFRWLIMICDSLWHLHIAGSATDITN